MDRQFDTAKIKLEVRESTRSSYLTILHILNKNMGWEPYKVVHYDKMANDPDGVIDCVFHKLMKGRKKMSAFMTRFSALIALMRACVPSVTPIIKIRYQEVKHQLENEICEMNSGEREQEQTWEEIEAELLYMVNNPYEHIISRYMSAFCINGVYLDKIWDMLRVKVCPELGDPEDPFYCNGMIEYPDGKILKLPNPLCIYLDHLKKYAQGAYFLSKSDGKPYVHTNQRWNLRAPAEIKKIYEKYEGPCTRPQKPVATKDQYNPEFLEIKPDKPKKLTIKLKSQVPLK